MNSNFYDNSIFANNLKRLMEKKDISAAELSRKMGVSKAAVSDWLKGKSLPRMDKVDMLCVLLSCKREDFTVSMPSNVISVTGIIKVYGNIAAGAPILAEENIIDYVPTTLTNPDEYFGLRVEGDSMIGAGIPNGANVILRKQNTAENGQIVACRVNGGEATLKRFRQQNDTVMLLPENSNYVPIIVPVSDFENGSAEILGVLKEINIRV